MGTVLDLDARRAERARKPRKVRLGGETWELPNPLPLTVAQDLAMGNVRAVLAETFGAKDAEEARAKATEEGKTPEEVEAAGNLAAARVVGRVGRYVDGETLEELFDELYDMKTGLAKRGVKGDAEDTGSSRD